jgi:hypothetical protein
MGIVADEILELQRAFDDAELRGDAGRLGDLLADDFLSIGETVRRITVRPPRTEGLHGQARQ